MSSIQINNLLIDENGKITSCEIIMDEKNYNVKLKGDDYTINDDVEPKQDEIMQSTKAKTEPEKNIIESKSPLIKEPQSQTKETKIDNETSYKKRISDHLNKTLNEIAKKLRETKNK